MPKFVLPSLAEALAHGRPQRLLTLVVAGFCRYLRGVDEQGQPIALHRRAAELRPLANESQADPRPLLTAQHVFSDLGQNEAWVAELTAALRELDAVGARATIKAALTSSAQSTPHPDPLPVRGSPTTLCAA